jgi:hypothetical protein
MLVLADRLHRLLARRLDAGGGHRGGCHRMFSCVLLAGASQVKQR